MPVMEHEILMALASILRREISPEAQDRVVHELFQVLPRLVNQRQELEEPVSRVLIVLASYFRGWA